VNDLVNLSHTVKNGVVGQKVWQIREFHFSNSQLHITDSRDNRCSKNSILS